MLAPFVSTGRLAGLERQQQTIRQITVPVGARAKCAGHRPDHVGARQHVAGDRELIGELVPAPRHAARSCMAKPPVVIDPVHLTDLAIAIFSEEGAERHVDRHTLSEQRDALPAEIGIDARLGRDGAAR